MAEDPRNEALAAEHAAVWTYGVLAARTSGSSQPALRRMLRRNHTVHALARDTLLNAVDIGGAEPAVALPSYPLPAQLDSAETIRSAAREIEARCGEAAAWVISELSGEDRLPFVQNLQAGALRELELGGAPAVFPGAADLGA